MRILTWNLWWRFGPWQERQAAIAETLAEVDADIGVLQEVYCDEHDGDQLDTILAPGLHRARSERSDGVPYRFGNAVVSRWPISRAETVVLPGAHEDSSHRSAVLAEVATSGGPCVVVSTHLEWRYDQSRTRQRQLLALIDALADFVDAQPPERPVGWPVVLAGDFNVVPDADELRRLTGLAEVYRPGWVFTDAWSATTDEPGHTWTRENPHSADAQWPRRRLDHVFVAWPRPKPRGNPLTAELVGTEPRAGVVPSDHYGVVVTLDEREPFGPGPP